MQRPTKTLLSFSLLVAGSFVASTATAQEPPAMPSPAKQLDKLAPMIGNWRGEGTVVPAPGQPSTKWRATAVTRKVLGGHWLRTDESIEFQGQGDAKMPDLAFRSFHGWDGENNRYVAHTISNMGTVESVEVFVDDNKVTSSGATVREGKPVLSYWTTEFTADGSKLLGRESIAGSDFFTHVEGTMKRAGADATAKAIDAAFTMGPPSDPAPMQRLAKAAGTYRLTGSMIMEPGQPSMQIGGTSTLQPIWGGSILELRVKGDPNPGGDFEGWGAFAWDPRNNHYSALWVDSMGDASTSSGHWVDDKLVFRNSRTYHGAPLVQRGVIELDADGKFESESWTALMGTAEAYAPFQATYAISK